MNDYDYFVFDINKDQRVAVIEDITHGLGHKTYLLRKGVKCSDYFLSTKECVMHEDGGDMITDFIDNIDRCVVISEKVKKVFEEEGLDDEKVEYLPFILKDKRGRNIPEQYYIANSLVKIDCFDEKKSDYISDEEDSPEEYEIEAICVEKDKIPEDAMLFRLGIQPQFILIRSDLVERIKKEDFTGLSVTAMGQEMS